MAEFLTDAEIAAEEAHVAEWLSSRAGDLIRVHKLQQYMAAARDRNRLAARVVELEAALKPFAECAETVVGQNADVPDSQVVAVSLGDCRRAALAGAK